MKMSSLSFGILLLLLTGCVKNNTHVESVISSSSSNENELRKVLDHYKHIPEKLDAAKFLIANMRYHHSFHSQRNSNQHPLLDSLTNIADSLLYYKIYLSTDSFKVGNIYEESRQIHTVFKTQYEQMINKCTIQMDWKYNYDHRSISANQLINHIDCIFKQKSLSHSLQSLSKEDFYEYILSYRSIPYQPLIDFSNEYANFMSKYLADINKDSIQEVVKRYNLVIGRLRNFFPSYTYNEVIGYQELFFKNSNVFHDCIPIANYCASILRACGIPTAVEYTSALKQFQGTHYHAVIMDENNEWKPFNPEYTTPTKSNTYTEADNCLNIYRFMFSEQKDTPFFLKDKNEFIPTSFDTPFIKDVTSHLVHTITLSLPYNGEGCNNLAYLAVFNSGMSTGLIPVTWGKINWKRNKVLFQNVIPDRFYFPIYFSEMGEIKSFGEPFYLDKNGQIEKTYKKSISKNEVLLHRKFPLKSKIINRVANLIGTVVLASNNQNSNSFDTIGIITDTLKPYFQDIILNMKKGPYKYYQIKTPDKSPRAIISEVEFITDKRLGYKNVMKSTSLPIFSPKDSIKITKDSFDIRLMDAPLEKLKHKAEYDGNPQTSPELFSTIYYTLERPQFVTKIRIMPLHANNGIVVSNEYELLYWDKDEWKKLFSTKAKHNYIQANVPPKVLLWLRNRTEGKEELPFYIDDKGKQNFIYK